MVAFGLCAACTTGDHDKHTYWIQEPPKGVIGGHACGCSGPDECAGNGEKLISSLLGEPTPARPGTTDELREELYDLAVDHTPDETARGYICGCYQQPDGQGWADHFADAVLSLPRVQRLLAVEQRDDGAGQARDLLSENQALRAHIQRLRAVGQRHTERHAAIVREATDLCWKATPRGQDDSGAITSYLLPAGVVHRLLGALQAAGYPATFRALGGGDDA